MFSRGPAARRADLPRLEPVVRLNSKLFSHDKIGARDKSLHWPALLPLRKGTIANGSVREDFAELLSILIRRSKEHAGAHP